jgi:hypothetical protein
MTSEASEGHWVQQGVKLVACCRLLNHLSCLLRVGRPCVQRYEDIIGRVVIGLRSPLRMLFANQEQLAGHDMGED